MTATCERYGISRTLFYRLRGRFQRYGPAGLHPKRPGGRRGRTPELPVADERRVIAEALAWPTRGPQWISDRLAQAGLTVAPVTAWRVLRRHGLNHRLARLAVLEEQSAATGLLTERTARRRRGRPVVAAQPGELCAPGTFYVGKLKGVGKVWQLTACDCASSYGWARVVVGEVTAAVMAAFLVDIVRPARSGTPGPSHDMRGPTGSSNVSRGRCSMSTGGSPFGAITSPAGGSCSSRSIAFCASTITSAHIGAVASAAAPQPPCSGAPSRRRANMMAWKKLSTPLRNWTA